MGITENKETKNYRPSAYFGTVKDNFENKYVNKTRAGKTWYLSLIEFKNSGGEHIRVVATPNPANVGDNVAFVNEGGVIYAYN